MHASREPGGPSLPGTPAVELCGLVKEFPIGWRGLKVRAIDGLTLRIDAGQVYGLLGPNGSGKSTTIKLLLGLLEPTRGDRRIFGLPASRVESRRAVGYLPESPQFYGHLSGRELVRFHGRLCGMGGSVLELRITELMQWVDLTWAAGRRVSTYSKGMLQRVGLAQAVVHDPRLLILDEPTSGLDPVGVSDLHGLIAKLKARGTTVLMTSHHLAQAGDICDRIAVLDRGRLVLEAGVPELVGQGTRRVFMTEALPAGELAELRHWFARRGRSLAEIEPPRGRLDCVLLERMGWNGGATGNGPGSVS